MINYIAVILGIALTAGTTAASVYYLGSASSFTRPEATSQLQSITTNMSTAVITLNKALNNPASPDFSSPTVNGYCPSVKYRQKYNKYKVAAGASNLDEPCMSPVVFSLSDSGSDPLVELFSPSFVTGIGSKPPSVSWRWLAKDYVVSAPDKVSDYINNVKAGVVCLRTDSPANTADLDVNGRPVAHVKGRVLRNILLAVNELNADADSCNSSIDCKLKRINYFVHFSDSLETNPDVSCKEALRGGNIKAQQFLSLNPNETDGNLYRVTYAFGV